MLRVVIWIALILSGCAFDQPEPIVRTKIRYISEPIPPTSRATCKPLKETGGQMASCAEAAHYYSKCEVTKLDRNMNGVPCENLCGQKPEAMCARIRRAPMFMSEGRMSIGFIPSACTKQ